MCGEGMAVAVEAPCICGFPDLSLPAQAQRVLLP